MKKILLTGILSVLFMSITFAQPKVGITAGLNASNWNLSGEGAMSTDFKAGFQLGLVADFSINESFSFMPELLFGQRGCKIKGTFSEEGIPETSASMSLTLNYLQLPLNLAFKFDTGNGSNMFLFAGPYIGYGLSSSAKVKVDKVTVKVDSPFEFGSKDEEIKPLDFGVNVGVGYQFEKIFFKVQCNPGLSNLVNESGSSMKNMNVAVTAGYYFF